MAVRNYFSGCEGDQHFQAVMDAKAEHVLMSFLYLQKRGPGLLKRRVRKNPGLKLMIDSGAHTFQVSMFKAPYSTWTIKDFEDYVAAYAAWLLRYKDYLECAVELDIEYCLNVVAKQANPWVNPYGLKIVEAWQDKYFRPLEEKGLKIIYVWHEPRGMDGWEEMCSKFPYCGLPGEFSGRPDFNKYMIVARRYMTRLHGFAATAQRDFRDAEWYSVDSTTWKSSERYGTLIHWDEQNQKLRFLDKDKRPYYRSFFQKYGLNANAIITENPRNIAYRHVTKYALISMVLMEKFYVKRYSSRTFFYERRLPEPRILHRTHDKNINRLWTVMGCDDVLKKDRTTNVGKRREILYWISLVQHRKDAVYALKPAMTFWEHYFEEFLKNTATDPKRIQLFQKEVAQIFMPPNPPPLARVDPEHFLSENNPPKAREVDPNEGDEAEDYEWNVLDNPMADAFEREEDFGTSRLLALPARNV